MDLLRFILRLPFILLRAIGRVIGLILRALARFLRPLTGEIRWQPPRWLPWLGRASRAAEAWVNRYPGRLSLAIVLLAALSGALFYGYHWLQNRPSPIDPAPMTRLNATVNVQPPATPDYRAARQAPQRLELHFSAPAAPIAQIGKTIAQGVTLTPATGGVWTWENERTLVFTAQKTLPMGQRWQIKLDAQRLLAPQIVLDKTQYEFTTQAFGYRFGQPEFYQDPQNPQQKKAIFPVIFNAPVDVVSFEKQIALSLPPAQSLAWSVVYDDKKTQAWVHSAPLALPDKAGQVRLSIGEGVKSTVAAGPVEQAQSSTLAVPGLYSLAVTDVGAVVAESGDGQSARALIVGASDAVNERQIKTAVRAWLLPQHRPGREEESRDPEDFYRWSVDDIDNQIMAQSSALTLTLNDVEQPNQPQFSFAFDAPANRFLLVEIDNALTSVGGYKLKEKIYRVVNVADYPQTLRFMSQGALLSLQGEKKITVAARNVPGLQLDIKRVIPGQLQHIVSFKERIFSAAGFRRLDADYFTEHFTYHTALDNARPGETTYQGIDLGRYLGADGQPKRGIFLLSLTPWDPHKAARGAQEDEDQYDGDESEEDEGSDGADSRFVVITDLGIISKKSQDESRDVFVQSISAGSPVSGASVSVVAKNGVTLLKRTTGADGHVRFPSLEAFRNERSPVMLLVEKEGDVSFLPLSAWYDRGLDFSRFDTYGAENPVDPRTLSSYLFSDRGLYRPGDTFHIGLITRTLDWQTSLAGMPLRAEIRDPRATVMSSQPLTLDSSGFSELSYATAENSPTGEWMVYLYLLDKDNNNSRLLGSTSVQVKAFEPDQMKVALKLTPDRPQGWIKPQELKAAIEVQNLFGTPAQNRRVSSRLTLRPVYPSFGQYPDYRFYENRRSDENVESGLEDQTTDANGQAEIPLGMNSWADATWQLQLVAEAFEAGGGRSVSAAANALISPYDYLVGVRADGDLDYINHRAVRHLNVIAINSRLETIPLADLSAELVEQKYLSVLTRQDSGVYKYQSRLKEELVATQPLTLAPQGGDITLATDKPGTFVLAIKDKSGRVLNRVNYTVAGNANVSRSLDRNAELKLKLNKALYRPGEEIEVAINAPYTGSGIITIERDKVYSWQWFHSTTTSSVQKIRLPAEMEGNGYINVQFVRDQNSDEIFMSPLSYGVLPFSISREGRQAAIAVSAPPLIKPGETLAIHVTTDSPQKVAVFAVDEGILQVARYRLRDPLDYFFRKRTLSVESAQILDLILPEFSKLAARSSAPGGDGGEGMDLHLNPFKRKQDKPVTYWSGLREVNGSATFNYPVPDYFNGKIRVMAVSVTPQRIGHAQSATTVRDDFVLTPSLPATVAPGDEFDVSVGVANNLTTLNGGKAEVKVALTLPPALQAVGESERTLTLAEKQEGMASFRLRALDLPGSASVVFSASGADKSARRSLSLSVRPAMPYRTQSVMGRMAGRQQSVDHLRQMFPAFARREALVSYSPLVLTDGLAKYLADYPNDSSEQIVSRAVPLLFQLRHPEMRADMSEAQIREQLKRTLGVLLSRQNNQGAIGTWRSTPQPDPFMTAYAVQFLLEAREAGYPVPDALLGAANGYLRQLAADNGRRDLSELRLRSFAAWLLTRQQEVTTGLLATVQSQLQADYPQDWRQDLAALYLAASYSLLQMDDEADRLLQPTWQQLNRAWDKAWWTRDYLDPLVRDSTRLYLISRHFPQKAAQMPPQLLENIVLNLQSGRFTTLSSAMSILALDRYASLTAARTAPQGELTISSKGEDDKTQVISTLQGLVARASFSADSRALQFSNPGSAPAWYVVTQSGYDRHAPREAVARGLEISREYTDEQGKPLAQVTLGQKVNVHVKIRAIAGEGLADLAIVDLLPGGFEVVQQTPPPAGEEDEAQETDEAADDVWLSPLSVGGSGWRPDYSDIREDRVILYGSATREVQAFVYQIKSTNSGVFSVPPAYGEAMYDREIQAMSAGRAPLTVVPPAAR
ncbi:alpha-2-macroglobulin family protein [Affinibrenneria salicis]|uniref:Alpha-2-macroglobulin family protein n=1 Tax=Affinibrenneria salicis TaxID=2590031 RepID=A0A5J5FYG1_9GAMM|nr:alpha-2-macroglobulin [Affinibrenneria salicis]KAA8998989.1 alpha-2-macroglobulin family protein [Affinibrenneria salicis]